MIDTVEFHRKIEALRAALEGKLRVKGADLDRQIRRAGRRLPKRQRRAAAVILGAQDWMGHPRLARLVDHRAVNAAFGDLHGHLGRLDPGEARKTALLRFLGGIVLNLMVFGALLYLIYSLVGAS
ncbi:hypothetical protein ACSSV8_000609 [Roseovarius sp. MBR-79]